ncbi:IS3 family transposase [Actinobacillus seminis]
MFNHIDPLKQVINEDVRYYNKERIQLKLKRLSSIQYQAQSFK